MTEHLLPTTVVGSYPQPDWLVDRAMLETMVPRVRMHELWRVPEPYLAQAQDDATLLAIRDMERAGIDIITDGEMRRESYSNRFATALDGIDNETPATITNRAGRSVKVPRVVGKIRRSMPVEVERHDVPAAQHRAQGEDHAARPVHHGAAGQERVLRRRRRDGDGLRRRGERGGARPPGRRRRRDPARRALAAQRSGGGQAHRGQGDRSRASRSVGADDRAPVLRLCRRGAWAEAERLFVPAAARRQHGGADFDRGGAAEARPRHARRPCRQDHRARRHRPRRPEGRDRPSGWRNGSATR